ncbi:MAG: hypothetical protein SNJ84_08690, partial [Verrucomicrobiia bacterium]
TPNDQALLIQIDQALPTIRTFLGDIPPIEHQQPGLDLRLDSLHALDHLTRLLPSARQDHGSPTRHLLAAQAAHTADLLHAAQQLLRRDPKDLPAEIPDFATASRQLAAWRKQSRATLLEATARGECSAEDSMRDLDALRWIDQIAFHTWRLVHHLADRPTSSSEPSPCHPTHPTPDLPPASP